jgi:SAM-dependent methyltransferase
MSKYTPAYKKTRDLIDSSSDNPVKKLLTETVEEEAECIGAQILHLSLLAHYKRDRYVSVLDVGCGDGRTMYGVNLDILSEGILDYCGIDIDKNVLPEIRARTVKTDRKRKINYSFHEGDFFDYRMLPNEFDMVYSSFNTIGMMPLVPEYRRQEFVNKMAAHTKEGGRILNITWNRKRETIKFMKDYYPRVGLDIFKIVDTDLLSTTILTDQRTGLPTFRFDRVPPEQLIYLHEQAGIEYNGIIEIGPLWTGVLGTKVSEDG